MLDAHDQRLKIFALCIVWLDIFIETGTGPSLKITYVLVMLDVAGLGFEALHLRSRTLCLWLGLSLKLLGLVCLKLDGFRLFICLWWPLHMPLGFTHMIIPRVRRITWRTNLSWRIEKI